MGPIVNRMARDTLRNRRRVAWLALCCLMVVPHAVQAAPSDACTPYTVDAKKAGRQDVDGPAPQMIVDLLGDPERTERLLLQAKIHH
ncbi:unnamed protein product, partial [marine sediment metagenome]